MELKKNRLHFAAFFLLLIVLAKGLYSASVTGQTTDETYYLGPGYLAVRAHQYAIMEHPPLAMSLGSFPLLFLRPEIPYRQPVYLPDSNEVDCSKTGSKFLYQSGHNPYRILFWARLPIVLLTVMLAWTLFRWGTQLYGSAGALLALTLFAFDSAMTAHGSLFTSDMTLTAFFFLAFYRYQKFLIEPSQGNLLWAGLATGLALLAKISAFLLFPLFLGLLLIRWLERVIKNEPYYFGVTPPAAVIFDLVLYVLSLSHRIPGALFGPLCLIPPAYLILEKADLKFGRKGFWLAAVLLLAAWTGTWLPLMLAVKKAPLLMRLAAFAWALVLLGLFCLGLQKNIKKSLQPLLKFHSWVWVIAGFVMIFGYLDFPKAILDFKPFAHYLNAFSIATSHMARFHVHCHGGSFISCDWRYFIACIAAKTSLVTLALFFLGLAAVWRTKLTVTERFAAFLPGLAFLLVASFMNRINIGLRHVLAVYPFIFLLAGFSLPLLRSLLPVIFRRFSYGILAAGLAVFIVRSLSVFPNDLAYFSEWVGGPLQGAAMTSDSNIDWGQDNRKVFELAKKMGITELNIGMTTGLDLEYNSHGIPWKSMPEGDLQSPAPGFYVLDLHGYLQRQRPGSWFLDRKPDYVVGATRYLFHVKNS